MTALLCVLFLVVGLLVGFIAGVLVAAVGAVVWPPETLDGLRALLDRLDRSDEFAGACVDTDGQPCPEPWASQASCVGCPMWRARS